MHVCTYIEHDGERSERVGKKREKEGEWGGGEGEAKIVDTQPP